MSKCARACVREAFKISTAVADDIFMKVDIKMRSIVAIYYALDYFI